MTYIKKVGDRPGFFIRAKDSLLDLLFPSECLGCGKDGELFCKDCLRRLESSTEHSCIFCGKKSLSGNTCHVCRQNHSLDGVFSAGYYGQKDLGEVIKSFKYKMIRSLSSTLSDFSAASIRQHRLIFDRKLLLGDWSCCPIPLHPKRLRWRGFNQSESLTESLSKEFGWTTLSGLKRTKNSKPQAKLDGVERLRNIMNCFTFRGDGAIGKKVILIDDVATTGTTLEAGAKALKAAGAKCVWGLTVAKG